MQCILHQNPEIYGSPTSPLLEYIFAARSNYELPEVKSQNPELMFQAFLSMSRSMIDGYYKPITDRRIVCDKNRGHSHYFELWGQILEKKPKMICMVRDLRSIIASFERIYRKNRHSPQGIDNPRDIKNISLEQRIGHWLNTQPVGLALARTLDSLQTGTAKDILFVRYEDLCSDPTKEMKRVYEYIEEPLFEHNFKKVIKEVEENDSVFGIFGNHSVNEVVEPVKYKDWEDVIPDHLSDEIKKSYPWYFNTFNY